MLSLFEKKFSNSIIVIITSYLCEAFIDRVNVDADPVQVISDPFAGEAEPRTTSSGSRVSTVVLGVHSCEVDARDG